MRKLARDLAVFAIIAGGGIFLYVNSEQFPQGADIFPRFLIIALLVLSLVMIGQSLYPFVRPLLGPPRTASSEVGRAGAAVAAEGSANAARERWSWTPFALTGGGFLYLIAINIIGFFVSSVLFLTVAMYLLGIRRVWIMVISEAVLLVFIYLVFVMELHVALPTGFLI